MTRWLSLIAKGIAIAVFAAMASWAYLFAIALNEGHGVEWARGSESALIFSVALLGTFAIGLPIAFFAYRFSALHMAQSFVTLAMVAVLSGIMLILASFVVGDMVGVRLLGIPAFIAAITFGLLGWFWIIRPQEKIRRDTKHV